METEQKIILFIFLLQAVWCDEEWPISLPKKIEALSGSCVTINCSFTIKYNYVNDLTASAVGMWHQNGTELPNVVFNSSNPNHNIQGNISGQLKNRDCTTIFYNVGSNHAGNFFFRIVGNGKLKWTYKQSSVLIHVIDAPPTPTVKMFKEQKLQVQEEVLEGSSVSLRCSAKTLCSSSPPTLTWSSNDRLPLSVSSRLQEQQILSDLNFTATHLQHGVTFTCTITYQLHHKNTTAQSNITLHVQYAPKNTSVSVSPSAPVLEGSSVTLTCSSDANPAVNYTWSRENGGQLEQLRSGNNLTFNGTDRTQTGRYYCQARNQHGTQNTSVMLDIQYATKISLTSSCTHGDLKVYSCKADGNPSPKVEWHLSGRLVNNSTNTSINEERSSSTDLRSFITLHQSLKHTDVLQCISTNDHGTVSQQIHLVPSPQENTGVNLLSVLIGTGIGASVIIILCVIKHICKRSRQTKNSRSSKLRREDTAGLNLTDRENEEAVYANKVMQSPVIDATLNYPESLHYSCIDFTNIETESGEIRGLSSLTADYAVVQHYYGQVDAKCSVEDIDPKPNISTAERESQIQSYKADSVAREPQFGMRTDIAKLPALSKKTIAEMPTQSDEVSDIYAQINIVTQQNKSLSNIN